jgi:hypothetical protein
VFDQWLDGSGFLAVSAKAFAEGMVFLRWLDGRESITSVIARSEVPRGTIQRKKSFVMSEYTNELLGALSAVKAAQEETGYVWVHLESIWECAPFLYLTRDLIQRQLEHGLELGLCCNPAKGSYKVWKLRAKGEELV